CDRPRPTKIQLPTLWQPPILESAQSADIILFSHSDRRKRNSFIHGERNEYYGKETDKAQPKM
ncbi:MAG TPA: hypothetical protein PKY10_11765, partial [Lentisphaeria bacterium]|nr:hypothetical protein [Lentisphaeria bacterium]